MSNYFKQVPDFEYVSRLPDAKISDYIAVKNFFKKGKIREDLFQDLTVLEKYNVKGDDRPDNVANDVYGDPTLDWVVLMANNITNVQSEWPLSNADFYTYLTEKYDAVNLVKIASEILGGKGGGGRKDFAQAGGVEKNKVEKAFKEILKKIN